MLDRSVGARWRAMRMAAAGASIWLLAACGGYGVKGRQVVPAPIPADSVVITYLGSGGWLIESGDASLLTGPLFSNPRPWDLFLGDISVDTAMADRRLAGLEGTLANVRSILVGHGHYDHLMDVPYVRNRYAPEADVVGSFTVANHIRGWSDVPEERIRVIDDQAGDFESPGTWITDRTGRFRYQPVVSEHSPHAYGIHLWMGDRNEPHDGFPSKSGDWVEGPTYAYLIDVLDDRGRPFFRVYYQDSGATAPKSHPSPELARDDGVPMAALLTAPGHKWEEAYPDSILSQLQPEWVLVSHWEDFLMRDADDSPKPIPFTFFDEWVEKMERLQVPWWEVPAPLSRWVFVRQ